MIHIIISQYDKEISLCFNGHAGHDKVGKDIVCAGVSALFYALYFGVRKIAPDSVNVSGTNIFVSNITDEIKGAITAIFEGLKAIEHDYPECVKIDFSEQRPSSI